MQKAVRIAQLFVAVLFIVSGLVKANDPVGLSYKMQEFFELWSGSLSASQFFSKAPLLSLLAFLHEQSLALSVVMIALEVVAGAALLAGWRKNLVLSTLILLIVFFTFLTGYAYLSGRFTNCGCFGDCLPITPLTSYLKDIGLLVLILLLWWKREFVRSLFTPRLRSLFVLSSLLLSLLLMWYVLNYLPLADCLPFKKGNVLADQMKPPPGAITDSFAIRFIYEKEGKRYSFSPEELPADFETYTYIDRKDQLVRKGNAEPALKGFSLVGQGGTDSTEAVLQAPRFILVFGLQFSNLSMNQELRALLAEARQKGWPSAIVSPSAEGTAAFFSKPGPDTTQQFFNTDFTVVRTAARTNPTIYLLENGRIKGKFSARELDRARKALSGN
jgi:uncharacterized membrane protein YphA (DoxX/SURF4 family)